LLLPVERVLITSTSGPERGPGSGRQVHHLR
jgi:hypothetical protein